MIMARAVVSSSTIPVNEKETSSAITRAVFYFSIQLRFFNVFSFWSRIIQWSVVPARMHVACFRRDLWYTSWMINDKTWPASVHNHITVHYNNLINPGNKHILWSLFFLHFWELAHGCQSPFIEVIQQHSQGEGKVSTWAIKLSFTLFKSQGQCYFTHPLIILIPVSALMILLSCVTLLIILYPGFLIASDL